MSTQSIYILKFLPKCYFILLIFNEIIKFYIDAILYFYETNFKGDNWSNFSKEL